MTSHVQTLIACAIVALVVWYVQQVRVLDAREELAVVRAELATGRAEAEAAARATEHHWREAVDEIAVQFEEERKRASEKHAAVVADLESGAARLRAHWQGCQATGELSAAAASAASADDAAALRREGAADLVSIGDSCDAQVRGLQASLRAVTDR